jgi:5-hydroxyisourate hydrolase
MEQDMNSGLMERRDVLGAASMVAALASLGVENAAAQAAGGRMTVHVLDLFSGTPANGVKISLFTRKGEEQLLVKSVTTGLDGRPESGPLLTGDAFAAGRYVIAFDLSDYFKAADKTLPPNFFRKVSMEFEVTDAKMPHHIPLQCTPWTQACSVLPG